MKMILALLFLVLVPLTNASAGGVRCQLDNSCPGVPEEFLSGSFCKNQNGHITGYTIYGSDDVFLIDSRGVASNPDVRHRIQKHSDRTFSIQKIEIFNNKIIESTGEFSVIDDNTLSLAGIIYSTRNCSRR